MGKSWWVDVSRTSSGGKRRSKLHIAYDGWRIVKVRRPMDLPVAEGDEVFIDVMFPEILDDLAELLKKGVRVYLLRWPKLVKKVREELGLRKTDVNDAKVLSEIPKDAFKELTLNEVEVKRKLQPLLERYEAISNEIKRLKQREKYWKRKGYEFDGLRIFEKELKRARKELEKKIIKIAENRLPLYRLAGKELGLHGVCLATLVTYVDFSRGMRKIWRYMRDNRRIRGVLARYAASIYGSARRWKNDNKYATIALTATGRKEALKKIQSSILKDLRRPWRNTSATKPKGRAGPAAWERVEVRRDPNIKLCLIHVDGATY